MDLLRSRAVCLGQSPGASSLIRHAACAASQRSSLDAHALQNPRWRVLNATQSSGDSGARIPALAADLDGALGALGVPPAALPKHVALVMDGNSRWAQQHGRPAPFGHQEGVAALRTAVACCRKWDIPCLTVYAFSLENWQRAREEVEFLLGLVDRVLRAELPALRDAGVRVRFIGELELLPEALRATIAEAEAETAANTGLNFTIALSYSGRQDICNAVQQLARQVAEGVLQPDDITPDLISAHLSTRRLPAAWQQPDLIIRSSGEQRLSNFLLWESAYAEMYFSSVLWPDFSAREFAAALTDYAGRQRRYGRRA